MKSLLKMRVVMFFVTAVLNLGLISMSDWATAQDDLNQNPVCQHCGMNRVKFAHSRVLVKYEDGSIFAACSLRFAAEDLAQKQNKAPEKILVADYNSKKLIEAAWSYWVVGGSKRGVMRQTRSGLSRKKRMRMGSYKITVATFPPLTTA